MTDSYEGFGSLLKPPVRLSVGDRTAVVSGGCEEEESHWLERYFPQSHGLFPCYPCLFVARNAVDRSRIVRHIQSSRVSMTF